MLTKKTKQYLLIMVTAVLSGLVGSAAWGEDWPTYQHDNNRSGVTGEALPMPLREAWVWNTGRRPEPANAETPARQDFWQNLYNNKSRVPIDNAFRVIAADGYVYLGSSNSDKILCLDARTGEEVWKFYTGGPIRFAPTYANGKVYFGSDDGYVYCVNASDGSEIWSYSAIGNNEKMMVNGRMISVCPVRTGILVDGGIVYWGAGLFSGNQTGLSRHLCAVNADTGALVWKITPPRPIQGYPLASGSNLYMPSGKVQPTYYRKSDGAYLGAIGGGRQGGAYALISDDNKLYVGPHYSGSGSYIGKYNASSGASESVAWGPGNHLIVGSSSSFYSSDTTLIKIRRSDNAILWSVASAYPYELIMQPSYLYAGGDNEVAAISKADGSVVWTAPVNGRVRGLAVANGALFVSTDTGSVHCFRDFVSADLDKDAEVRLADFAAFTAQWMQSDCGDCGGADIAGNDSFVNEDDLALFCMDWMDATYFRYE